MTSPWHLPLIGVASAWSPSTPGEVRGTPLYLGDTSIDEIPAMADEIRGAIVLFDAPVRSLALRDRPQPTLVEGPTRTGFPQLSPPIPGAARRAGFDMLELAELNPAVVLSPGGEHGVIFVGSAQEQVIPLPSGDTLRTRALPRANIATEHYNLLVRLIEADAPVELRIDLRAQSHEDDLNAYNVLAEIPGTDPALRDEIVMIGAHLDSWHGGVGATDNADAVAATMEAMRLLMAIEARPRRTIQVALWAGEEQGLLGSQAHVAQHLADSSARDRVSVYLNDDPGTGPTYGFYMEDNRAAMNVFDRWLGELAEVGVRRNVLEGIGGTDHSPFDAVGIPAFTAIKDYTDYDTRTHHTNVDLAERVRIEDLTQSAIVLASMAWLAATSDERVPRRPAFVAGTGRWGLAVGNSITFEPVAGVRVVVEGTPHQGVTNERGELVLEGVPTGRYDVTLEHAAFATLRRENMQITSGRLRFTPFWLVPR
jgi:hypothetical protein